MSNNKAVTVPPWRAYPSTDTTVGELLRAVDRLGLKVKTEADAVCLCLPDNWPAGQPAPTCADVVGAMYMADKFTAAFAEAMAAEPAPAVPAFLKKQAE